MYTRSYTMAEAAPSRAIVIGSCHDSGRGCMSASRATASETASISSGEPINTTGMPGYFLHTAAQARRIMDRVGHDNLFLQLDLYHCQIMTGNLSETIKAHLEVIDHFQIAGHPGRHEPDVGEIHYPYLFDLIDELEYTGWVGCEYRPRADTVTGLAWLRSFLNRAAAN